MVTNVVTLPGESFLNISGNTLHIKPRHQGGRNCNDAYFNVLIPACSDEGAYIPAQSGVIYIRNADEARLIAQAFTELAEVIQT